MGMCGTSLGGKPGRARSWIRYPSFYRFFRRLPQGSLSVHSFRTVSLRILIAEREWMRDSAITASVNETLPVIAKVGSAAVFPRARIGAS